MPPVFEAADIAASESAVLDLEAAMAASDEAAAAAANEAFEYARTKELPPEEAMAKMREAIKTGNVDDLPTQSQREAAQRGIENKNAVIDKLEGILDKVRAEGSSKIDFRRNAESIGDQPDNVKNTINEVGESITDNVGGRDAAAERGKQIERDSERETDPKEKKKMSRWAKVLIGLGAGTALVVIIGELLAIDESGCFTYNSTEGSKSKKLDCNTNGLEQACLCPKAPDSLVNKCTDNITNNTCSDWTYMYIKIPWWEACGNFFGGLANDLKRGADAGTGILEDIEKMFAWFAKNGIVVAVIIVVVIIAIAFIQSRGKKGGGNGLKNKIRTKK